MAFQHQSKSNQYWGTMCWLYYTVTDLGGGRGCQAPLPDTRIWYVHGDTLANLRPLFPPRPCDVHTPWCLPSQHFQPKIWPWSEKRFNIIISGKGGWVLEGAVTTFKRHSLMVNNPPYSSIRSTHLANQYWVTHLGVFMATYWPALFCMVLILSSTPLSPTTCRPWCSPSQHF